MNLIRKLRNYNKYIK